MDKTKWLELQLEKHDEKLEKISDHLASIDKTLAVNTESLQHHILRTDLLEKRLDSIPNKLLMVISIVSGLIAIISKFIH